MRGRRHLAAALVLSACTFGQFSGTGEGEGSGEASTADATGDGDAGTAGSTGPAGTSSVDSGSGGGSATGADSSPGTSDTSDTSETSETADTGQPPPEGELLVHLSGFEAGDGMQAIDGVGFEPVAVLFWITDLTAPGTTTAARIGRGWTDGVNDGAAATAWQAGGNAVASRLVDDACITLVDESGSLLAEAAIASFDPDGFTVSWSTDGGGRRVWFLALGGGVSAAVGERVLVNGTESFDGLGFEPTAVLMASHEVTVGFGTDDRGGHGVGIGVMGSSHSSAHRERDNGVGSSGLEDGPCLVVADDSPLLEEAYVLESTDADGFTLARASGTDELVSTFIALGGVAAAAGTETQPVFAGAQDVAGLGFTPRAVLFDGGDKTVAWEAEPEIVHGVGIAGARGSIWMGRLSTTSGLDAREDAVLVSRTAGAASPDAVADLEAFGGDGFTLDWETSDGIPRVLGWLAIGDPSGT